MPAAKVHAAVLRWFEVKGFAPLPFQEDVWTHMQRGESGLLHATTGAGKTLAVALGAWQALQDTAPAPLFILWITPMRALAADTARALEEAFAGVAAAAQGEKDWSVGLRTADTPTSTRAAQDRRPPTLLVTTPESLTLMLARADAQARFAHLRVVVVDEWHELLGEKRGVQTQLALARLKKWRPGLLLWGMSATLGNLPHAKRALLGPRDDTAGVLVSATLDKKILVDALLPDAPERFPLAGRMGLKMLPQVVPEIEAARNSLIFTNTRNQAEVWYQALLAARPDWQGLLALHHASLAQETRHEVETGLKSGALKAVVCTSSLDLGVDFLPVERVLQIGSPKGVARLLQRAGRSGHAPGRVSRVTIVPTHSLELVEAAATRTAVAERRIESRESLRAPLDVLAQHLVTIGLGGGFASDELFDEVREAFAYENLSLEAWRWCLDFVRQGGPTLGAYPQYRRCAPDDYGVWRVTNKEIALRHRLNVGTIVNDASVLVQFGPAPRGAKLGSVEERFVSRLKPGDKFWFAGRLLQFVALRDLVAFVKKAPGGKATTPRWDGGRMPLSTTLAASMVERLHAASEGVYDGAAMQAARPMLELQRRWSALPQEGALLAEALQDSEGSHLFVYPFAGRNAHLGLASLLAWRAATREAGAFSLAVNDYGFSLLSATRRDWLDELPHLLGDTGEDLAAEIFASLNASELARRRFRVIAQISGLVFAATASARKTQRQIQSSAGLIYDVFRRYDPENGLLAQAEREALEEELDVTRIRRHLAQMRASRLVPIDLARCSPLAFPLLIERLRERLSNESLAERIERMALQLEKAADV